MTEPIEDVVNHSVKRFCTAVCLSGGIAISSGVTAERRLIVDFEGLPLNAPAPGFGTNQFGSGSGARWQVVTEPSAPSGLNVLQASSPDDREERFPVYLYDDLTAVDVDLSVRFKVDAERSERAAGLVLRWQDADHFYYVRADAEENNVRLYRVIQGRRRLFASTDTLVDADQWQILRMRLSGSQFDVALGDRKLFSANDNTLTAPGKVGLLIRGDGSALFDDLSITVLPPQ